MYRSIEVHTHAHISTRDSEHVIYTTVIQSDDVTDMR